MIRIAVAAIGSWFTWVWVVIRLCTHGWGRTHYTDKEQEQ